VLDAVDPEVPWGFVQGKAAVVGADEIHFSAKFEADLRMVHRIDESVGHYETWVVATTKSIRPHFAAGLT
jgi:hypothetical protein